MSTKAGTEEVTISNYGMIDKFDPYHWPDGDFLRRIVQKHTNDTTTTDKSAAFWQTSARRALLSSQGLLPSMTTETTVDFSLQQAQIRSVWETYLKTCATAHNDDDLCQFLTTHRSRGRVLKWAVMHCHPGCQFRLHAHPNLELAYCIQGALHEIRWKEKGSSTTVSYKQGERDWKFGSLTKGQWLVNAAGSVHKSFTASNQDCMLLVLWGGSHENLEELDGVTAAVESADARICRDCTSSIPPTFLPDSERFAYS